MLFNGIDEVGSFFGKDHLSALGRLGFLKLVCYQMLETSLQMIVSSLLFVKHLLDTYRKSLVYVSD
jgi:hypothetical protein